MELSDVVDGNGGFAITGIDPDDQSGFSVSGGGDINGDDFPDVIIGAPRCFTLCDPEPGESYVVFNAFAPRCSWDLDGDGMVGVHDLLNVLISWLFGCPPPEPFFCGDVNSDGVVTIEDLILVITNWGP